MVEAKGTIYTQETVCLAIKAAIWEMDINRHESEADPVALYNKMTGKIEAIIENAMAQISPDEIATDCPY